MPDPSPCSCATPEEAIAKGCQRGNLPMVGRLYQLCSATGGVDARVSDSYRRLWDGLPPLDLPDRAKPCHYLGEQTGELRQCGSCRGNVRAKVHRCLHPGHAANPTTTVQACGTCEDWRQDDPFVTSPRSERGA